MNLFQVAWLSDEQVEMFQSDFKVVADYFVQKRKNNGYTPTKTEIKHVEAVLQLLSVMEHDDRFIEIIYSEDGGKVKNMCDVLDIAEQRGEIRGEKRGVKRGEAAKAAKIMRKMYGKGYMIKEIAQITDEAEETVKEILQLM